MLSTASEVMTIWQDRNVCIIIIIIFIYKPLGEFRQIYNFDAFGDNNKLTKF